MQMPVQITFHQVDRSPVLETAIREHAAKLEELYPRLTSCRVVVEATSTRQAGKQYSVRVDMTMPNHEIIASNNSDRDVYVALRDGFDAAKRRLASQAELMRGAVKYHERPAGAAPSESSNRQPQDDVKT
jgi:ribosome-associated translation inhibitor RaiA